VLSSIQFGIVVPRVAQLGMALLSAHDSPGEAADGAVTAASACGFPRFC